MNTKEQDAEVLALATEQLDTLKYWTTCKCAICTERLLTHQHVAQSLTVAAQINAQHNGLPPISQIVVSMLATSIMIGDLLPSNREDGVAFLRDLSATVTAMTELLNQYNKAAYEAKIKEAAAELEAVQTTAPSSETRH